MTNSCWTDKQAFWISLKNYMANIPMRLRVVEESRISPPPGFWVAASSSSSSSSYNSLPLSFLDILWAYMDPVSRLFLYPFPHPTSHFMDSVLPNLKSSLSLSLRQFYPLAGNLIRSDPFFEIRCQDGDTVLLTVAEAGYDDDDDAAQFQQLCGGCGPCDFTKVEPLIPPLTASATDDVGERYTPVLAIQVTVFPNHGISLGVTVHHAVCDGSSSIHFLKYWASAASTPPPLVVDRSLIADPRGLSSVFLNQLRGGIQILNEKVVTADQTPPPHDDDSVLSTFALAGDCIRCLKEFVMGKSDEIPHCSTFVVACAYVWVCLAKAQNRGGGGGGRGLFAFAVDCRSRLSPPIPPRYFGNCLCACFAEANWADLVGDDGLVAASEAIGRAIQGLQKGRVLDDAEGWMPRLGSFHPGDVFSVAGSPKFGVYDIDFGWGKPHKVMIPSIQKTGAMSLAETRDGGDGGGGVEIGLVLHRNEMNQFTTSFSEDLKRIHHHRV